jgi:hypothetical protein
LLLLVVAYTVRVARRQAARGRARAIARAWHSYLDTDEDAELLAALLSSAPPATSEHYQEPG